MGNLIKYALKYFLGVGLYYVFTYVYWLFEGPHITAQLEQGIPPRFYDQIVIATLNFEWWTIVIVVIFSIIFATALSIQE